jgi:hypothetical protein
VGSLEEARDLVKKPIRRNTDDQKRLLIRKAALEELGSPESIEALARFIASREIGYKPYDVRIHRSFPEQRRGDVRLPRAPYDLPATRHARVLEKALLRAEDLVVGEWNTKGMLAQVVAYTNDKFSGDKHNYDNRYQAIVDLRAWLARLIRRKILSRPIVEAIMKARDMRIPLAVYSGGGYGLDVPAGEEAVVIYDNWDGAHVRGEERDERDYRSYDHADRVEVNSFADADEPLSWFGEQGGHAELARDQDTEVEQVLEPFQPIEEGDDIEHVAHERAAYFADVASRHGANELGGGYGENYDWLDYTRSFAIELAYEAVGWLR